jgi:hypothetical protein
MMSRRVPENAYELSKSGQWILSHGHGHHDQTLHVRRSLEQLIATLER